MSMTDVTQRPVGTPPSVHQLALMIWLAVFPTLTIINLVLGDWLSDLDPVPRTLILTTIAVPVVIYGIMPRLQRAPRLATRQPCQTAGDATTEG